MSPVVVVVFAATVPAVLSAGWWLAGVLVRRRDREPWVPVEHRRPDPVTSVSIEEFRSGVWRVPTLDEQARRGGVG